MIINYEENFQSQDGDNPLYKAYYNNVSKNTNIIPSYDNRATYVQAPSSVTWTHIKELGEKKKRKVELHLQLNVSPTGRPYQYYLT